MMIIRAECVLVGITVCYAVSLYDRRSAENIACLCRNVQWCVRLHEYVTAVVVRCIRVVENLSWNQPHRPILTGCSNFRCHQSTVPTVTANLLTIIYYIATFSSITCQGGFSLISSFKFLDHKLIPHRYSSCSSCSCSSCCCSCCCWGDAVQNFMIRRHTFQDGGHDVRPPLASLLMRYSSWSIG